MPTYLRFEFIISNLPAIIMLQQWVQCVNNFDWCQR